MRKPSGQVALLEAEFDGQLLTGPAKRRQGLTNRQLVFQDRRAVRETDVLPVRVRPRRIPYAARIAFPPGRLYATSSMRIRFILIVLCLTCGLCSCARDLRVDRRIPYARPQGRTLRLDVYQARMRPATPLPAIVAIHGGAWLHGPRAQQWWYLREFARRGYVVFTVDYRKLPRHRFPACLHDVKSAVRWMRLHADEYGVDPDRIYAFGASAGGHLSAFLATSVPEDGFEGSENPDASSAVNAAISLYGAVDLTLFDEPPESGVLGRVWRWYVWHFVKDAARGWGQEPFEFASPAAYARPCSKPILFVHGKEDSFVHFRQSEFTHARLCALGVPAGLILFENRGHAFDYVHWRERKQLFASMLAFLEAQGGAPVGTVYSHAAKALPEGMASVVDQAAGP